MARLTSFLADNFIPVDLSFPGIRVLNIDPPVLAIDDFLPAETCDMLTSMAEASPALKPSGVAAYNAAVDVRTSRTLPLTKDVLQPGAKLTQCVNEVLERAMRLLPLNLPTNASAPGMFQRPTAPGQFVYEQPQVTSYDQGQHFLAHEDAFPWTAAQAKGYQRQATVLMYLNDVPEGGCTCFNLLEIAVRPQKGKALLFFPAFGSGRPDPRSVHTAEDAVQRKWVSQLWLSRGVRVEPRAAAPAAPAAPRREQKKKKGGAAKGFGARK